MTLKAINPRFLLILTLILTGALFRFVPHWPNFTPVAAMALFGGAYLERKWLAYLIPLAAMLISDAILGLHQTMWAVYLGFILTVLIGTWLSNSQAAGKVILGAFGSALVFFLVTNFGAWLSSPIYPRDITGLMASYAAGLAFFHNGAQGMSFFLNDLAGTLIYSGIFFGVFSLMEKRFPVFARTA